MGFQKPSTTRLPQSLRDELDAQKEAGDSNARGGRRRNGGLRDRKAERKAGRQQVKQRKAEYFSHNASSLVATNKRSTDIDAIIYEGPYRKKPNLQSTFDGFQATVLPDKEKELKKVKECEYSKVRKNKEAVAGTKLKTESAASKKSGNMGVDWVSREKRSKREEDEEAYTSMLERQLGIDKKKKGKSRYGAGFEDDGLLDLLLDLDEKVFGDVGSDDNLEGQLGMSEDEGEDEFEVDVHEVSESREDSCNGEDEEEWTGIVSEGEEYNINDKVESSGEVGNRGAAAGPDSGSKYVPPHLRKLAAQMEDTSEVDEKLARLLKGLLNRLSEQNIDSILKEIEGLYRSHRRHDITATLTSLIIEGTCSHSSLLDAYVALHAGLVACLHRIIGVELAAFFVQNVVANFERHYTRSTVSPTTNNEDLNSKNEELGKECSNLLVLLSDLYNYHVISCTLMYDIIRSILEGDLSELDVELILKLARGSGTQLRQDDPSALKDIIQVVQNKIGDQRNSSSRTRFMVETLNNIKNNKVKRDTAGSQGGGESKERIAKFVNGIDKKYHVHTHEPLRISLEDLHQADSKGKWWLVGAAWGGDPLVDQQAQISIKQTHADAENVLLKLARKQGMNTDVRRSVFIVLMSSDDYVDACDRLGQLNLTEIQQREIVRVLLHCCGNEKSYNPYYTLIAQHLCRQTHSHRVTLQYCFWDFLRTLGETNVGGADMARDIEDGDEDQGFDIDRVSSTRMANVARAYAWWVAKDCLAITILKTLDFIALKNKTKTFLTQFFTQLFSNTQDPSPVPSLSSNIDTSILGRRDDKALVDVFVKAKRLPELSAGIVHFLSSTFREGDSQDQNMNAFMRWGCDVATDVLQNSFGGGDL